MTQFDNQFSVGRSGGERTVSLTPEITFRSFRMATQIELDAFFGTVPCDPEDPGSDQTSRYESGIQCRHSYVNCETDAPDVENDGTCSNPIHTTKTACEGAGETWTADNFYETKPDEWPSGWAFPLDFDPCLNKAVIKKREPELIYFRYVPCFLKCSVRAPNAPDLKCRSVTDAITGRVHYGNMTDVEAGDLDASLVSSQLCVEGSEPRLPDYCSGPPSYPGASPDGRIHYYNPPCNTIDAHFDRASGRWISGYRPRMTFVAEYLNTEEPILGSDLDDMSGVFTVQAGMMQLLSLVEQGDRTFDTNDLCIDPNLPSPVYVRAVNLSSEPVTAGNLYLVTMDACCEFVIISAIGGGCFIPDIIERDCNASYVLGYRLKPGWPDDGVDRTDVENPLLIKEAWDCVAVPTFACAIGCCTPTTGPSFPSDENTCLAGGGTWSPLPCP